MTKNILFITELTSKGSGYTYLMTPLMRGLAEMGYDVKAIGLGNKGEQHDLPVSIIPAPDFKAAHAIANNLHFLSWKADVLVIGFDIPHQKFLIEKLHELPSKIISITPLENPPLIPSWAAPFYSVQGLFLISDLATKAAHEAGLDFAEHLKVGADTDTWYPPKKDERKKLREYMGLDDKFVVLTVADNQERKNLWAAMDIVSKAKKSGIDNLKYILVTREHSAVGHNLRDLAMDLDITQETTIIERGISQKDLLDWYHVADVYLQTSKAEGLGLPVLEAMSCGVPVIATDTGAMTELLDTRGCLIAPEYSFTDVWGNSKRDMINREQAKIQLVRACKGKQIFSELSHNALQYVKSLTWDIPIKQLVDKIEEITNE